MDGTTLDALRGFDGVWGRVTGTAPAAGVELCALIEMAARQRELYCALARRCPSASGKLERMARDEQALIRRLCAENFLLTGECGKCSDACAVVRGVLSALRSAYLGACELAVALDAAANAASGELCATLRSLAAAERCREQEMRELILRAMGANCT